MPQATYLEGGQELEGKHALADVLETWLRGPHADTIGEPGSFGGRALLHVVVDGHRFHLNGDTKSSGVRAYLDLVREHGPELDWHVVANRAGKVNKVAFGSPPAAVPRFYLYADDVAEAPWTT